MRNYAVLMAALLALSISGCKKTPQANGPSAENKSGPPPVAEQAAKAEEPTPSPTPSINKNAQVVILGYHRVTENVKRPDTEISPADFEAQMQQLKDQGIQVIPLQDLLAWKRGEKEIPAKSAVITFDDGWKQQYTTAWPILKKFDYPFTLFVYTDYIKGGPKSGGESITWEQLAEMRDAGVDIQGHTISHKDLRGAKRGKEPGADYDAWLWNELNGSKQAIEQRLGIQVNALALPYGFYNQQVQEVAKKAGYEAIFTVYGQKIGNSSQSNAMGRYMIVSNNPKIFASAVKFGGSSGAEPQAVAELSAKQMGTQPPDGETVSDQRPLIKMSLENMEGLDPKSVTMRVSSLGAVNAKYDPQTKTLSYQPTRKLSDNTYTVIVSGMAKGKKTEARWQFTVREQADGR